MLLLLLLLLLTACLPACLLLIAAADVAVKTVIYTCMSFPEYINFIEFGSLILKIKST